VALSGDWLARIDGVEAGVSQHVLTPGVRVLQFDKAKLGHWDSGPIAFLADLREAAKTVATAKGDAAAALAMTSAIDRLATQVAATVETSVQPADTGIQ